VISSFEYYLYIYIYLYITIDHKLFYKNTITILILMQSFFLASQHLRDMKYIGFKHQRENKQNSDKVSYYKNLHTILL
jgi:hypothetical protein